MTVQQFLRETRVNLLNDSPNGKRWPDENLISVLTMALRALYDSGSQAFWGKTQADISALTDESVELSVRLGYPLPISLVGVERLRGRMMELCGAANVPLADAAKGRMVREGAEDARR